MSRTVRSADQLTMFDTPVAQHDLFAPGTSVNDDEPEPPYKAPPSTREEHHEAMLETLAMLRECSVTPWNSSEVRFERVSFRLRSEWFPDDVAAPLLAAFAAEAERLDMANAPPPAPGNAWHEDAGD